MVCYFCITISYFGNAYFKILQMNILLKSATIIDASSKHHLKKRDILIENGIITKIAVSISNSKKNKEIKLQKLQIYNSCS